MRGAELHRPQRPRRAGSARNWWRGQKLELPDAPCSLANAGTGAIGAGIAAADDHDTAIARVVRTRGVTTLEPPILRRQEIHCQMNARQLASGNVEVARSASSRRDTNGIELSA